MGYLDDDPLPPSSKGIGDKKEKKRRKKQRRKLYKMPEKKRRLEMSAAKAYWREHYQNLDKIRAITQQ